MTSHPSHPPVSALRERMIEDMTMRGFGAKTREGQQPEQQPEQPIPTMPGTPGEAERPVPLPMADTPSPSLMVKLADEIDLNLDPALKAAAGAIFRLQDRYRQIIAKQAAIEADERLSDRAKAQDRATVITNEGPKPFEHVEAAIKDLIGAQKAARAQWRKIASQGGADPREVAAEPEIRGMVRSMSPAERLAFVGNAVREHDLVVLRACLLSPTRHTTGLSRADLEMLSKAAAEIIDPSAARLAETLGLALFRLRGAVAAYARAVQSRGLRVDATPRWAIAPATSWHDEPNFELGRPKAA